MTKKSVILAVSTAAGLLVIVISFMFWFLRQSLPGAEDIEQGAVAEETAEPEGGAAAPSAEAAAQRRIRVKLFFLASSGKQLVAEETEIPFAPSLQEQAKQVVRQLLSGSERGRGSAFPRGVKLREVFITPQGLAFVDLSQELIKNHPGGTCAEELTVYSLANTLIANFPAVKKVRILVEGREIQTLAGHLDLSRPYGRGPGRLEQS